MPNRCCCLVNFCTMRSSTRLLTILMILMVSLVAIASAIRPSEMLVRLPERIQSETGTMLASMWRRDLRAAKSAIARIGEYRIEAQIPNLPAVAGAFLYRLREISEEIQPVALAVLAQDALIIAPDLPDMYFALAGAHMKMGLEGIGPATGAVIQGLQAHLRFPRTMIYRVANVAFYGFGALVLMVVMAGAMMFIRYRRLLTHDISDFFPSAPATIFSAMDVAKSKTAGFIVSNGLLRIISSAFVLLLAVAPLVFGAGLLPTAVLWLISISAYTRRTEKLAVVLLIGTIGVLPIIGHLVLLPAETDRTPGHRIWSCYREYCTYEVGTDLVRMSIERPNDVLINTALGNLELQQSGNRSVGLEAAIARFDIGVKADFPVAIGLSANSHVLKSLADCPLGEPDKEHLREAQRLYTSHIDKYGAEPAMLRGLAIVQGLLGERDQMEASLTDLLHAVNDDDLDFVARIRTLSGGHAPCRQIGALSAEIRPPSFPDQEVYFGNMNVFTLPSTLPWHGWLQGRIPIPWIPIISIVGLILVMAAWWVGKKLKLATVCPRCNNIVCQSCNTRASGYDYCPTCLFEQVKPAFLDPLDLIAIQQERESRSDLKKVVAPILAILLPGSGQVLSGRPVRGLLMLLIVGLAVGFVLHPASPHIDALAYAGVYGAELPIGPPILLIAVYTMTALDVWLNREK